MTGFSSCPDMTVRSMGGVDGVQSMSIPQLEVIPDRMGCQGGKVDGEIKQPNRSFKTLPKITVEGARKPSLTESKMQQSL